MNKELSANSNLSHYRIVSQIGAGGMGEVYLAQDSHYRLPENRGRAAVEIALEAVNEVGNPTILATFAVIAAILPMAFVSGLMGPYMRPIPVGASAAMVFSLLVAFVVTPWGSLRLLRISSTRLKASSTLTRIRCCQPH